MTWDQLGPDQYSVPSLFYAASTSGDFISGKVAYGNGTVDGTSTDALLSTSNNGSADGPVTFNFGSAMFGAGAYIDSTSQFTVRIQAFEGVNSVLDTTVQSNGLGDPLFIGAMDSQAQITKIIYSLSSGVSTGNFTVGKLYLQNTAFTGTIPTPPLVAIAPAAAVPEPATFLLIGSAMMLLFFIRRKGSASV